MHQKPNPFDPVYTLARDVMQLMPPDQERALRVLDLLRGFVAERTAA
jgi:hypothetical protein